MDNTIIILFNVFFLIIGIIKIVKVGSIEKLIINHKFWLYIAWEFSLLLYSFSGIVYPIGLKLNLYIYILVFLGTFFIGGKISRTIICKKYSNVKNDDISGITENKRINLFPLFLISLISTALYIITIHITNPNIILGITRGINTNMLTTLFLIFNSSSLIIWLYELSYSIRNRKKIKIFGVLSALLYNIPGIVLSGRDALMIFIISSSIVIVYSLSYLKKNNILTKEIKRKIKFTGLLVVTAIVFYLLLISNIRYGKNDNSVLSMFKWASGANFPDYLIKIYSNTGVFGKLLLNIVFYYSSQFSKLALVYEHFNGPYQCGLYQFHYVARLLPEFMGVNINGVSNVMTQICNSYSIPGIKVLWGTAIEYSVYDFGRIGALVYSFIIGFIIERIVIKNSIKMDELNIITRVLICVGMFTTVEISPLYDYFYVFPIIWLIFIKLLRKKNIIIK